MDVLAVGDRGHARPGEHARARVRQGGGHVILGGQRVGGREEDPGAARPQGADQARRLRRHVQAGSHGQPGERLLTGVALGEQPQHGHAPLRPADPGPPGPGQALVRDVGRRAVLSACGHRGQ